MRFLLWLLIVWLIATLSETAATVFVIVSLSLWLLREMVRRA